MSLLELAAGDVHCHHWHASHKRALRGRPLIEATLARYGVFSVNVRANGKPNSDINVSVSHSGLTGIVTLARNADIGCDIEQIRQRRFLAIAQAYFHSNEVDLLNDSCNRAQDFYRLWTLKEAYGKWQGDGLKAGLPVDFSQIHDGDRAYGICFFAAPIGTAQLSIAVSANTVWRLTQFDNGS